MHARTDRSSANDDPPDSPVTLPQETVFTLLQNERRRYVLEYLDSTDGPVEIRDLSEHVAARENDQAVSEVTYQERKRVYTSLYQIHLPKLADAGVVDYDRRAGVVSLAPASDACLQHLAAREPDRWWRYYLLVGVGALLPILAAAVGVPLFAEIPGVGYAAVVAAAFCLLAGAHALRVADR